MIAVLGPAALVAGCGESHQTVGTRPPDPVTITALIDGSRVKVSPASIGAGPIVVLASNQSGRAQRMTFESAGSGPGIRSSTAIPLDGTGQIQVDPKTGSYQLSVGDRRVRPASLKVGDERKSAQNVLMRP